MTKKDLVRGLIGGAIAGMIGFGAAQASNGLSSTPLHVERFVDPATGCHYLAARSWPRHAYAGTGVSIIPRMMPNGRQFCQASVPVQ